MLMPSQAVLDEVRQQLKDMGFNDAEIEYCLKAQDIFVAVDDVYLGRVRLI